MVASEEKIRALIAVYNERISQGEDNVVTKYGERDDYVKLRLLNDLNLLAVDNKALVENIYQYIKLTDMNILRIVGSRDKIFENIDDLRAGLRHAKYGKDEPVQRAHNLIYGNMAIKGYGIAFWSPIMQVTASIPNWNNITTQFMAFIGRPVRQSEKSFCTDYKKIIMTTERLKKISGDEDPNYINHFMKFVVSYEPDLAKTIIEE